MHLNPNFRESGIHTYILYLVSPVVLIRKASLIVIFITLLFLGIAKNENDVTEDKNETDKASEETIETVVFTETNAGVTFVWNCFT